MKERSRTRFDSIEEAHQYVGILREIVEETEVLILEETADAHDRSERYLDALRLVQYKLGQLNQHLAASSRLLNDLRTLRRALYGERNERTKAASQS